MGLDADNAETQEIIDEEIIAVEEELDFGEMGHDSAAEKRAKAHEKMKDILGNVGGGIGKGIGGGIGKHDWVENKDWWAKNAPNMDTSNMSKKDIKEYKKNAQMEKRQESRKKRFCKNNPDLPRCVGFNNGDDIDLDSIKEKFSHYDFETIDDGMFEGLGKSGMKRFCRHNPEHERCQGDYLNLDKNIAADRKKKFCKHNPDAPRCQGFDMGEELPDDDQPATAEKEEKEEDNMNMDEPEPVTVVEEKEQKATEPVESEQDTEPVESAEVDQKEDAVEEEATEPAESEVVDPQEGKQPDEQDSAANEAEAPAPEPEEVTAQEPEPTNEEEPAQEEPEEATATEPQPVPNTIVSTFTVIEQVDHDSGCFTQGLSYGDDGEIYETCGLYHQSSARHIDPDTFDVKKSVPIDGKYFGEGSTHYRDKDGNGRIIMITWREKTGFILDSETLEIVSEFAYTTTQRQGDQGWGITYDKSNHEFIVSDGSVYLYVWDADTLEEKRRVGPVTRFDGREQDELNELEFMDGLVCCNIWHDDHIICVDPVTGKSVREYDMSSLWPVKDRGSSENVLNGIAIASNHVLLTGKRWDRMFKISFDDWPAFTF